MKQPHRPGIACPVCGHPNSAVIDKRNNSDGLGIYRRRVCQAGHRFSTHEGYDGTAIYYIPDYQI